MTHPLMSWDIIQMGKSRRELFADDLIALRKLKEKNNWNDEFRIPDNRLIWEDNVVVVTSPGVKIDYVTKNVREMTGYHQKEVIGQSPKMFQGVETSVKTKEYIRQAIERKDSFQCDIVNYRKDKSIYVCHIEAHPIFNNYGELVNFISFETKKSEERTQRFS
jgi:PAS domain S-box-containing protein